MANDYLKETLEKEAPETLLRPKREEFISDESYESALQKFQTEGHWATPADQRESDIMAGIITSENSQPSSEILYNEPQDTQVFDATRLTPPLTITPPEEKVQTLTEQLRELNLQLVGQAEFRAEEEEERGIPGLTKQQQDLTNQLKLLQAEYQQIPLQIQEEFEERGVTAAGVAPIEAGRLRKISIRALGVSAMLEAAQGNLATAHDLVDRAVAQQFDPIREEINAKTANLNLILRSPEYTIAEKNRAQKQLDIQNAKKAELADQEADQKQIWAIATDAAMRGADALTLQKIREAKTKEEALQIAVDAGLFIKEEVPTEPTGILSIEEARRWEVPYGTTYEELKGKVPTEEVVEEETAFTTDEGETMDITTVEGVKYLVDVEGYGYADIYGYLDTNTKLTIGAIKELLSEAGLISSKEKENAMLDLGTTIDDYKELWKKEGDKNRYGTREQFGEELDRLFPELNKDEIMDEIYREVSDEWMEENKSLWRKVFGVPK